ncbi:aldose 1-epimerase family protein [Actinopolyspora mortivallis]|uniref:aldose 1-epimerase family protein n=1 Tax=Actinopolyspora mortivallis TaxID=33906 RepID=UPI0003632BBD|nr:aldose 1-epimerase family protein [Actinopolyspora mortivallis]
MNDSEAAAGGWSRRAALTTLTATTAATALGGRAAAEVGRHGPGAGHGWHEQTANGRLYEIRSGRHRAVVAGVAATLLSWRVDGTEMLLTHSADDPGEGYQGKTILPWPNRIDRGSYEFGGRELQVPINEPSRQSALHGLMSFVEWEPVRHRRDSVRLRYRSHPRYGYPFHMEFTVDYAVDRHGVRCTLTAENVGREAAPVGWANHTYVAAGPGGTDAMELRLPADTYYRTNERLIPTGTASVSGTRYDFRRRHRIGETKLDTAFTGLERDHWGEAVVRIGLEDGRDVLLRVDGAHEHLQVYTDDGASEDRAQPPRSGITVEPSTCPPNAFVTGEDVRVLAPGERHGGSWSLSLSTRDGAE